MKTLRDKNVFQVLEHPSPRGNIYDRNGELIAISKVVKSFYAVPNKIKEKRIFAKTISENIGVSEDWIFSRINNDKKFVWIKRKLNEKEVEKIEAMKIENCGFKNEYERFYPAYRSLKNLIGCVDEDEIGIDGIEMSFDTILSGKNYFKPVVLDATRKTIDLLERNIKSRIGNDIFLTIDLRIQDIVEEEVNILKNKWSPRGINAIVMDPYTFEVLAMCGYVYNAYDNGNLISENIYRNILITDHFEMGSIFKPFVMTIALDMGVVQAETKFYCEEGLWKIKSRLLRDHKSFGELTATEIIAYSSNIGISKVAFKIGKERLRRYIESMGFGSETGIGLNGEHSGMLTAFKDKEHYALTSIPIGHGITATPLQITRAFCALINGGTLKTPSVVLLTKVDNKFYKFENDQEVRIIKKETSEKIKKMLAEVVNIGTGRNAKLEHYSSGGKTGTAKKLDEFNRYTNRYISSYIGFAPYERPRLVVLVVVDEPKNKYYASEVVAPAVKNILERTLTYLNILPDR